MSHDETKSIWKISFLTAHEINIAFLTTKLIQVSIHFRIETLNIKRLKFLIVSHFKLHQFG